MTENGSKRGEYGAGKEKTIIAKGKERFRVVFVARDRVSGPRLRLGVLSPCLFVVSAVF